MIGYDDFKQLFKYDNFENCGVEEERERFVQK